MVERTARRLPESTRVEAFSDGMLAIAVTLLVLDLHTDFERGMFAQQLGAQWPSYAAYLAAFLNVSSIWTTTTTCSPGSAPSTGP
ncbi:TMEM175 family protein [Lapillicoccus sp.]|uniref:TMEM175 family protein n=1 Tax=Lapillicoccus sp. TaxID=1909287 RepID=UPI00387E2D16